jgi:hypothetical protein
MSALKQVRRLRIAGYFNTRSQTWVARHSQRIQLPDSLFVRKERVYGYGKTPAAAVAEVLNQMAKPVIAHVIHSAPRIKTFPVSLGSFQNQPALLPNCSIHGMSH